MVTWKAVVAQGGTCKSIFYFFILFYSLLRLIRMSFQFESFPLLGCSGGGGDNRSSSGAYPLQITHQT